MKDTVYSWLLFDADNTLLDFTQTSRDALWLSFSQVDKRCSEEIYEIYHDINQNIWRDLENADIDAKRLRVKRFELLFQELGEKKLSAELFSKSYLQNLISCSQIYEGVAEMLLKLKKTYRLSIVTNGLKEVQRPRLHRLGMMQYFDSIVVSDEIGLAKPDIEYFQHVYNSMDNPPPKSEMLIIGDSLYSDIQGGRNFGIHTCWLHHGRDKSLDIDADFEIENISQFPQLLQEIS